MTDKGEVRNNQADIGEKTTNRDIHKSRTRKIK